MRPIHTNEIPMFVEMRLELAMKRALDRFANATREMDIRGVDNDLLQTLFDIDDAVVRMLRFLVCLLVAREIYHIHLLLGRQRAAQGDDPGGVSVVNPMTSLADHLVSEIGRASCRERVLYRV